MHKNTTGNTKIVNCTMDEMSNQEIHRLKQKLQASQYKIKKLNENMTYVKLQNQALSSQLDELQQNYTNKNREKTHLAAKWAIWSRCSCSRDLSISTHRIASFVVGNIHDSFLSD